MQQGRRVRSDCVVCTMFLVYCDELRSSRPTSCRFFSFSFSSTAARQGKARQGKARQGKAKQIKTLTFLGLDDDVSPVEEEHVRPLGRRRSSSFDRRKATGEMNEEDEFGMSKTSRDADPMEQEDKSAVKDHPDFKFLDPAEIHAAVTSDDKRAVPLWMTRLPVEKDPSQWTILEVQIRPDRAWEVIKELVATVCIGKGLLVTEEHANSMLFRKKVTQECVSVEAACGEHLHIGVRREHAARRHDARREKQLVGGPRSQPAAEVCSGSTAGGTAVDSAQPVSVTEPFVHVHSRKLDGCRLYGYIAKWFGMSTVENAELDEGYVADLKRTFSSEMKANMRDLCIPLETYAYDQEFACALLIGLLEPSLKKYGIKLTDAPSGGAEGNSGTEVANIEALSISENDPALKEEKAPSPHEPEPIDASPLTENSAPNDAGKIYGEVISELVQNLWRVCKEDCEVRLRAKIEEKQQQVTARVEAVQALRVRAIQAIMKVNNVLLYEASCVVNGIPVTLHVTYGNLIYRTMVPVFARTTVIPYEDVVNVAQTTSFGIQVVSLELDSAKHAKGITIAMGLEVDLLFQLLHEIFSMHQREIRASITALPPLQQQETEKNPAELKKILGSEEEETKEDEGSPAPTSAPPSDDDTSATVNTTSS
ncbi:hypothetical protein ON010_g13222 [Phytophthora cinnamomi]|nr:hypothetical protein ON010_g13222 [Phytophthora cinnamomi]